MNLRSKINHGRAWCSTTIPSSMAHKHRHVVRQQVCTFFHSHSRSRRSTTQRTLGAIKKRDTQKAIHPTTESKSSAVTPPTVRLPCPFTIIIPATPLLCPVPISWTETTMQQNKHQEADVCTPFPTSVLGSRPYPTAAIAAEYSQSKIIPPLHAHVA